MRPARAFCATPDGAVDIQLKDIIKKFGSLVAVNRVSLSIRDGELFTLLGPSGCGKTTILRLIGGFHQPENGDILFGGRRVTSKPPYERNIGMVFQNYALWPHMTIRDNVAYGLKIKKLAGQETSRRVAKVLDLVNLKGLEERYPGQLSGGQQQRVALARALVLNPDVLLLDEPLSNLDAKIRVQVRAEIRKLQKELAITTIYVTHDQEEALTLSDRIAVVDHGNLQQIGNPRELYEKPENPFVADFIGTNNLIPGHVEGSADAQNCLKVRTEVGPLTCLNQGRLNPGDPCIICVRPETASINLSEKKEPGFNSIRGEVSFASYIGNAVRYDVEIRPQVIFKVDIQNPWNHHLFPIGETIYVHFPVNTALGIRSE